MSRAGRSSRSPWAGPTEAEAVTLHPPSRPLDAEIAVPGSKSFTNRALLIAALARGRSVLTGVLRSDDSYWLIDALRRLGVFVTVDRDTVTVDGCGGVWPKTSGQLFLGSAGTSARFLPGALGPRQKARGSSTAPTSCGAGPSPRCSRPCGSWAPTSAL